MIESYISSWGNCTWDQSSNKAECIENSSPWLQLSLSEQASTNGFGFTFEWLRWGVGDTAAFYLDGDLFASIGEQSGLVDVLFQPDPARQARDLTIMLAGINEKGSNFAVTDFWTLPSAVPVVSAPALPMVAPQSRIAAVAEPNSISLVFFGALLLALLANRNKSPWRYFYSNAFRP